MIRTKRGTIAVPFDRGGQHAIAKHLVETGKASTGGVTLEELAKYLPMAHEIGERKFDKGANRAVYRLTPPGESILVVYESASGKHYLYDVTQIERGGSTQYSMHWTPPLSGDTIHQLFGNSSEIRGSFTPGEKFAESFQAVIELVKGKANVSTLCHESAHWLKALMEALCEMKDAQGNFLASEQLRGESGFHQQLAGPSGVSGERGDAGTRD